MDNNKFFNDFNPGDEHVIKPSKPAPMYDCPYCDIIMGLKAKEDVLEQNKKAMVIKNQNEKEKESSFLVITKKHFMDLSLIGEEDLFELMVLTKKFAKEYKSKHTSLKGFKYISLQGEAAGQDVLHVSIKITPV